MDGELMPIEQAYVPVTDPALTVGHAVFDTLRSDADGTVVRLDAHLERLGRSAAAVGIQMPVAQTLAEEIRRVSQQLGVASRIRVTLTGAGRRVVAATPLDDARMGMPVRAVRGVHVDEPYLGGGIKHGSRAPWIVAVQRSGVDEVLLVDADGRFTEGTTCAILAVQDGVVWTAAHDGRILPSTTLNALLERAANLGIPTVRRGALAAGPWEGLYVASTTRKLAPVVELDGVSLPGWDPVGQRLADGF
jgi:branched-subunit amino acid aminotransferase/4-amino-4-deoxychorismate lyase